MILSEEKVNYRTESILFFILNRIIYLIEKEKAFQINNNYWAKIANSDLAKKVRCTKNTVISHGNKLVEAGILIKAKFEKDKLNHTNFWAINPSVDIEKLRTLFVPPIAQKFGRIYNINKSLINHNQSNASDVCFSKKNSGTEKVKKPKNHNVTPSPATITTTSPATTSSVTVAKPTNTTVQDMIKFFNETLGLNVQLTKERSCFLYSAFNRKFNRNLENWRKFLKNIKDSQFIKTLVIQRKDGFLDWLLSFKVINSILSGGFGCKAIEFCNEIISEPQAKNQAENHIFACEESEECKNVRRNMLETLGGQIYQAYLSKIKMKTIKTTNVADCSKREKIEISGDRFIVDYVLNNFLKGDEFVENYVEP